MTLIELIHYIWVGNLSREEAETFLNELCDSKITEAILATFNFGDETYLIDGEGERFPMQNHGDVAELLEEWIALHKQKQEEKAE